MRRDIVKKHLLLFFIILLLATGNSFVYAVSLPDTNQPNPHGQWTPSPTTTPPPRRPATTPTPTTADVIVMNTPNIINGLIIIGESAYLSIGYGDETQFTARLGELEIKIMGDNILPHTETRNIVRDNNGNYILDLSYIEFTFLVELRIVDVSHIHEGIVILFDETGDYFTSIELDGRSIYHVFVEPGLYRIEVRGEYIANRDDAPPSWTITVIEREQFVNVSLLGVHLNDSTSLSHVESPQVTAPEIPQTPAPEIPQDIENEIAPISSEETRTGVIFLVIVVVIAVVVALFFMMFKLYNEHGRKTNISTVTDEEEDDDEILSISPDSDKDNTLDVTVAEITTEF